MFIALLLAVAVAVVLVLAIRLARVSDERAQRSAWKRIADAREAIARARDALDTDTAALLDAHNRSCPRCGATPRPAGAVHPAP